MKSATAFLSLGESVMLLLAALTSVAQAAGSVEASGRASFEARCGACHSERDIVYWVAQRPDADDRAAWLDGVLQRHYPPPEDERAMIIDHIAGTAGAP
jgi:cytochrome c5